MAEKKALFDHLFVNKLHKRVEKLEKEMRDVLYYSVFSDKITKLQTDFAAMVVRVNAKLASMQAQIDAGVVTPQDLTNLDALYQQALGVVPDAPVTPPAA